MSTLSPEEVAQAKELQTVRRMGIEADAKLLNFKLLMVVNPDDREAFYEDQPSLDDYVERRRGDPVWVDHLEHAWTRQQTCTDMLEIMGNVNAALKDGRVYHAYLYYFSCTLCNTVDPVYYMNKTAAALKLRSWGIAERDATMALGCMIAEGDVMISKARYRRGRARLRMGRLAEAEEDLLIAARELPGDKKIQAELEKLRLTRLKTTEELHAWISARKVKEIDWDNAELTASAIRQQVAAHLGVVYFPLK